MIFPLSGFKVITGLPGAVAGIAISFEVKAPVKPSLDSAAVTMTLSVLPKSLSVTV